MNKNQPPFQRALVITQRTKRQLHAPGVCGVQRQQRAYLPVSQGVPMDAVFGAVLQEEAEVEVEVQHVHLEGFSQNSAVEVCFDHVMTQMGRLVRDLLRSRATMLTPLVQFEIKW